MNKIITTHPKANFYLRNYDNNPEELYMSRHAPYDLTDYHWAKKVPNMKATKQWHIIHNGRIVEHLVLPLETSEQEEYETVMEHLFAMDESAHLKPCIDRT